MAQSIDCAFFLSFHHEPGQTFTTTIYDLPHIAIPLLNDLVIIRKERYEVMDREFAPSDTPKFPQIFLKLEKI